MVRKLIFATLLIILATLALYLYVDHRVAVRLGAHAHNSYPAIYSDYFEIPTGTIIAPAILERNLLARDYLKVSKRPTAPGEYRRSGHDFEIFTQAFRTPLGSLRPASLLNYRTNTGEINNHSFPQRRVLLLEPIVIAPLGTREVKATQPVVLSAIPLIVQQAIIAVEDQRFYDHHGIDFIGIGRALIANLKARRIVQGGSTLTQQLAKNLLFDMTRSWLRKILEAVAALSLENRLTKSEILELYLNEVYMGQESITAIHGFPEAARAFFGKSIDQLTTSEAALLAGIVKGPSYYSPKRHLKRATARRDLVLNQLLELEYITSVEHQAALQEPIRIVPGQRYERHAPYYLAALQRQLEQRVSLSAASTSGFQIFSGFDLNMQRCAESAIQDTIKDLEHGFPRLKRSSGRLEAGLVAIEPFSGLIKAWVGGRDFGESQFDHVEQAKRQIGSTVKPFVYLTALDPQLNQYRPATPITILPDAPLSIDLPNGKHWQPENFDRRYRGDVTLRYALEQSLNVPAAYLTQRVGVPAVSATLENFRVAREIPEVPAVALGAIDTTLLELTSAYAALANGGMYVQPRLYSSILNNSAELVSASSIVEKKVAARGPTYLVTNILQGVVERGTGHTVRRLGYGRSAAGKTGTSNDTRDAWFVGYTPTIATGVWIGFDDNSSLGLTGGGAAAPAWTKFMKCIEPYHRDMDFIPPPEVVFNTIDFSTKKLATPGCPANNVIKEVFLRGTEPTKFCPQHSSHQASTSYQPDRIPRTTPKKRTGSFWDRIFGN